MAEILKAESYTAVTKTAKEEVYTLFVKINVTDDSGNVSLDLAEGASVGAYKVSVSGNEYTLTFVPPTGFLDDTYSYPSSGGGLGILNAPWNFLGAPTITLNYAESAGLVDGNLIIPSVTDYNFDANKRPYIKFGFLAPIGDLPSPVLPPEFSQILVTLRYTTTDKK